MKEKIVCHGCPLEFVPKRANQFYHNPKCRQDKGNARDKAIRDEKKSVQKPLNDNYKILKKILGTAESIIKSKEYLEGAGFNFYHYTAKSYTDNKLSAWRVFNYVLIELSPNKFQICRQDEIK